MVRRAVATSNFHQCLGFLRIALYVQRVETGMIIVTLLVTGLSMITCHSSLLWQSMVLRGIEADSGSTLPQMR